LHVARKCIFYDKWLNSDASHYWKGHGLNAECGPAIGLNAAPNPNLNLNPFCNTNPKHKP